MPAAAAVGPGRYELRYAGQGAQPLSAVQRAHERGELVAVHGGVFEALRGGEPVEFAPQALQQIGAAAVDDVPDGDHLGFVLSDALVPRTGRATAPQLVQGTGAAGGFAGRNAVGAAPHGRGGLERVDGVGSCPAGTERPERVGLRDAHDRQPGERFVGQHHPPGALRELRAPVVARLVRGQQA